MVGLIRLNREFFAGRSKYDPGSRPHGEGGQFRRVRWTPLAGQIKGQCKIVDCPFVPLISLGSSCPNCAGCQRLIPTAPVIIFRQSIATFNSPGKSRSVNPTGLIKLLLPATLYITSETGSVEYA